MQSLIPLFRFLELTRSQPQYGYVLAEIPKSELSDLAQHHYLVTFFGWQLAKMCHAVDPKINQLKILEICLTHDLGELFGGDIAMPYAKANPAAKVAASNFEQENQNYISRVFGIDLELFHDAQTPHSDEAIIAKIADYLEVTHYKLYVHRLTAKDVDMVATSLQQHIQRISSLKVRPILSNLVADWAVTMKGPAQELFEAHK